MDISLDEWHTIWKKYDPKHPQPWQNEYLKFMFFLMDTSGDKVRINYFNYFSFAINLFFNSPIIIFYRLSTIPSTLPY
jgi:hypothetical protein